MNNALVSIIIPCYNYGHFIEGAINSCLNQTYKNIEIIVVNDGSTDELTNKFFSTYSNPLVKLFTTENQGLAKARNYAIANSNGEYFVPLDADDKIESSFIEKTIKVMLQNPKAGVVYTDQQFFGEENRVQVMLDFDFLTELYVNHVSVCSLVKREAYQEVLNKNSLGYNPNMLYGYEDWDFWIGLAELGWEFKCVHEPLFWYRKSSTSMMSKTEKNAEFLMEQLVKNHKETYSKYALEILPKIHGMYKEKEVYARSLEKDTKNKKWLVKRLIKQFNQ